MRPARQSTPASFSLSTPAKSSVTIFVSSPSPASRWASRESFRRRSLNPTRPLASPSLQGFAKGFAISTNLSIKDSLEELLTRRPIASETFGNKK